MAGDIFVILMVSLLITIAIVGSIDMLRQINKLDDKK